MECQAFLEQHNGRNIVILISSHGPQITDRPGKHRRVAHLTCYHQPFLGKGSSRRLVVHYPGEIHQAAEDVGHPVLVAELAKQLQALAQERATCLVITHPVCRKPQSVERLGNTGAVVELPADCQTLLIEGLGDGMLALEARQPPRACQYLGVGRCTRAGVWLGLGTR